MLYNIASLGRPRCAPVRVNSFDGAHPGQPPVHALLVSGSLGGDLRCMSSPLPYGRVTTNEAQSTIKHIQNWLMRFTALKVQSVSRWAS